MPWRLEMLGGLTVVQGDRRISRFQTQKTGALLAYIALHPGKNHSRETLAELLWPDGDPTAIRNRLNQAISSLRRQLHPPELGPGQVLVTDHHSVGINSQIVVTDVEEFEREIKLAERSEDLPDKIRHLESAISKYKGELLEGYYEEWVFSKRIQLAEQYDQALQDVIRAHVHNGAPENAIEFARLRILLDPYDEGPHVILMRLFLRTGRPKSALKQFEELERALKTFDDEPSEYAEKFRVKAEAMVKDQAEGFADVDDDMIVEPQKKVAEPTALSREEAVISLPRVVSSFLGREKELKSITEGILERSQRLITILGLGGAGKSRLAIEVGWRLLEHFESRVFFVPLSAVEDDVPLELARIILSGEQGPMNATEAAIERLNELPNAVVILDNAEHLMAGVTDAVTQILSRTSNVFIVATSRIPFGLEGEVQLPLGPLPLPEYSNESSLAELASNPAIALFVERAQAVKADFQLTERTAEPIVELCDRLEGIPLGLELAASWARVLTPAQMLERILENVDNLASRRKDIGSRHRSLRAAFDGSYELLDSNLRDVFQRLTIFAGGWDYDAAQAICPNVDISEALIDLEERSMVYVTPTEDQVRFSMLETVRSFGESLVTPDLYSECGFLHSEYFLAQASEILPRAQWMPKIRLDYANHLSALRWLAENERPSQLAQYVVALARYWEGMGLLQEGLEWLGNLQNLPGPLDPIIQARAQAATGRLQWLNGQFEDARTSVESALRTFELYGADEDAVEARFALQLEAHRVGDYDFSKELLARNLSIAETKSDSSAQSRCLLALGNSAMESRDWNAAHDFYERSLEFARASKDGERIGSALTNLANLAIYRGHWEAAEVWLDEALEQMRTTEFGWRTAMCLIVRARLETATGKFARAAESLREAYRMAPDEKVVVWRVLMHLGFLFAGLEQFNDVFKIHGLLRRYRARFGEHYRGIEVSTFEQKVDELASSRDPDQIAEQIEMGNSLTERDIDRLLHRAQRLSASF